MEKAEITTAEQYDFIFSKENNRFVQIFYKVLGGGKLTPEEKEFVKIRIKKQFDCNCFLFISFLLYFL